MPGIDGFSALPEVFGLTQVHLRCQSRSLTRLGEFQDVRTRLPGFARIGGTGSNGSKAHWRAWPKIWAPFLLNKLTLADQERGKLSEPRAGTEVKDVAAQTVMLMVSADGGRTFNAAQVREVNG